MKNIIKILLIMFLNINIGINMQKYIILKENKNNLINSNLEIMKKTICLIFLDILECNNFKIKSNTLIHIANYRINTFTEYTLTKDQIIEIFNENKNYFSNLI